MASAGALAGGGVALADSREGHGDGQKGSASFRAALSGYQEVPPISTTASGTFKARLKDGVLQWRLSYRNLEGAVQQAHVHFGQPAVNGGVSVFLCSNLAGAPADVQRCPAAPATISGTAEASDVVGPSEQGIAPGELDELLAAMRVGATYANVHTDTFPNGEIRGQIGSRGHGHHGKHRGDDDD
ncbi:MAG TPA: CHRD domain-containing protein [Conexibacter sp.]|nr:CHRD domain-containing protein [Conexibacter sp.]